MGQDPEVTALDSRAGRRVCDGRGFAVVEKGQTRWTSAAKRGQMV
jgi:hypothetical protein